MLRIAERTEENITIKAHSYVSSHTNNNTSMRRRRRRREEVFNFQVFLPRHLLVCFAANAAFLL